MTPIGLLFEEDLLKRFPTRRDEIIAHALRARERERVSLRETRGLMTWHPVHTTKVVLLSGLVSFVLAWLFSEFVALSHWYAAARASKLTLAIPILGDETLDIGSHVPTSTSLGLASSFPVYGVRESVIVALVVMAAILLEKLVLTAVHWRDVRGISKSIAELKNEIAVLESWKRSG